MGLASRRIAIGCAALGVATLVACRGEPVESEAARAEAAELPAPIVLEQAKRLALERYNQLFSDKFMLGARSQQCRPYPHFGTDDVTHTSLSDAGWLIAVEPPAGFYFEARVDRAGAWVDVQRVGFADH